MADRDFALTVVPAAKRRMLRRLRSHGRHEQFSIRMALASATHHSHMRVANVDTQTDDDVPAATINCSTALAATHASTATLTLVDAPVTTAYSVPILHFSGDSVGIQSCVPLNNDFSCVVRNPVVPQMPEQIVETVNAIPQEWTSERIVGNPS